MPVFYQRKGKKLHKTQLESQVEPDTFDLTLEIQYLGYSFGVHGLVLVK